MPWSICRTFFGYLSIVSMLRILLENVVFRFNRNIERKLIEKDRDAYAKFRWFSIEYFTSFDMLKTFVSTCPPDPLPRSLRPLIRADIQLWCSNVSRSSQDTTAKQPIPIVAAFVFINNVKKLTQNKKIEKNMLSWSNSYCAAHTQTQEVKLKMRLRASSDTTCQRTPTDKSEVRNWE